MRGHLEARGKDVWRAKVFLGRDDATGRQRYLTRTIHGTKRQAEAVVNQLIVEAGQGSHLEAGATVADLSQRWMALAGANLSPTTSHEYRRLLDRQILPSLGTRKVRTLRAADLDLFYATLQKRGGTGGGPLSAQSVHHTHALIRRLLNQAVKWGWCVTNPATQASPPKVLRHELHLPTPKDVMALLRAANDFDPDIGCFLRLAAITGARRGELCALRWTDLDLHGGLLSISRSIVDGRTDSLIEKDTKTHSSRKLTLDDQTKGVLEELRSRHLERAAACSVSLPASAFVFSDSPDGKVPWRPARMTRAFEHLCETVGLSGVRLHDLRHFAATRMLVAGVPIKTVSGRLGHANAATTLNVYAHFLETSDAEAAKVLSDILAEPEISPTT
jgi:integrase